MLFEAYQELARRFPDACQHLFGSKIDGAHGLWLSLDAQGQPYLLFEMAEDEAEVREAYVKGVSLRSWVTAHDVADMVAFLASPAAAKISGQVMCVDGHTETLAPT